MHVPVERGETLLAITVDIVAETEPGLRSGVEPSPEQGAQSRTSFQDERPIVASPVVAA